MNELLTAWGPLGIGGVLAALMFWFYREDRQDSEKRLAEIIREQGEQVRATNMLQQEHIRVLIELKTFLQSSNWRG